MEKELHRRLLLALRETAGAWEEDWKLISALLGERETLRTEVKQRRPAEPPVQPRLFDEEGRS
jgi:hypothetical protein